MTLFAFSINARSSNLVSFMILNS